MSFCGVSGTWTVGAGTKGIKAGTCICGARVCDLVIGGLMSYTVGHLYSTKAAAWTVFLFSAASTSATCGVVPPCHSHSIELVVLVTNGGPL